jgi:hypothetical protein
MWPTLLAIALALAACTDRVERPHDAAAAKPAAPAATDAAPPPPSTPVPAAPAPAMTSGPMPASGAIGYSGFGPARFGATAEEVRMAWGKDMAGGPGDPQGCYYLYPEPHQKGSHRIGFMIENQRFSRLDVDVADIVAPGGGRVGMSAAEIGQHYTGLVEQPHKYVEGAKYLRHADAASGAVLVFETDASGKVTAWRLGTPPQVDYVEGCG